MKRVQPGVGRTHMNNKGDEKLREFLFETGFFASPLAQEEKFGTADFAVSFNHHLVNAR